MSFVKLYKVLQDGRIGYQTLNQAADNHAETRTQMYVEHGSNEGLLGPKSFGAPSTTDFHAIGRHDLDEIPRAVGSVAMGLQPNGTLFPILQWRGQPIGTLTRVSTGLYWITITGLSSFWATVICSATAGDTYIVQQRPESPSAANGGQSGLWVSIFRLSAGDFVPVDAGFTMAVYGSP